MTRFVVDAGAVLHLASEGIEVGAEHELLAPTLLRSQVLSMLHEAVQRGELPAPVALERLARIGKMPIRLLGDGVLRRRAWDVAVEAGMGLHLRRRVHRAHPASGRRVRDPGRGAGAPRRRARHDSVDRRVALVRGLEPDRVVAVGHSIERALAGRQIDEDLAGCNGRFDRGRLAVGGDPRDLEDLAAIRHPCDAIAAAVEVGRTRVIRRSG